MKAIATTSPLTVKAMRRRLAELDLALTVDDPKAWLRMAPEVLVARGWSTGDVHDAATAMRRSVREEAEALRKLINRLEVRP